MLHRSSGSFISINLTVYHHIHTTIIQFDYDNAHKEKHPFYKRCSLRKFRYSHDCGVLIESILRQSEAALQISGELTLTHLLP